MIFLLLATLAQAHTYEYSIDAQGFSCNVTYNKVGEVEEKLTATPICNEINIRNMISLKESDYQVRIIKK